MRAEIDVAVVGGGAAGVAAAVGAARAGARVALLERYGFLGGQATAALVGTVCGLYRRQEARAWAVGGFARDFAERLAAASGLPPASWRDGLHFLPYRPLAFRALCDDALAEAGVDVRLHATLHGVAHDGRAWDLDAWWWDRPLRLRAATLVDASGTGGAARLAGAPMVPAEARQAGALGLHVTGLAGGSEDVARMALLRAVSRAVSEGSLPAAARALSIVPGTWAGGEATLKLGLPEPVPDDPGALGDVERRARALVVAVEGALRRAPELAALRVVDVAAQLGVRTGPRPLGRVVLDEAAVLAAEVPDDAVALAAWPIERWSTESRPNLTLPPLGRAAGIPAGCLRSHRDDLFQAGRCLSADEAGVGAARVIGTALATGYAAGAMGAAVARGEDVAVVVRRLRDEQVPA